MHLQADQSVVLTLEPCLKASQKPIFQCLKMEDGRQPEWFNAQSVKLHGEFLTLNIGESPSVAVESSLSQILQPKSDVPQKCYLSSRACQGILRRAARRGKKLPPSLETALKCQAGAAQAIGHIVESKKSSTLAARYYKSPRNFVEYSKPELASGKPCTGTLMANASTKLWSGDQEAFSGNYFVIDKQQEVPLYDISHLSDGVREIPKGACNTLAARMGTGGGNVAVLNEADRQKTDDTQTLRHLTVTECERLQGLPDGWTLINEKSCSDSARYKAIGNGMAQPCADYVIQRIVDEVGKI